MTHVDENTLNRGLPSAASHGLNRLERAFQNLADLVKTREAHHHALQQRSAHRQTRAEAFREVQREKWLGIHPEAEDDGATTLQPPADAPRPGRQ